VKNTFYAEEKVLAGQKVWLESASRHSAFFLPIQNTERKALLTFREERVGRSI